MGFLPGCLTFDLPEGIMALEILKFIVILASIAGLNLGLKGYLRDSKYPNHYQFNRVQADSLLLVSYDSLVNLKPVDTLLISQDH